MGALRNAAAPPVTGSQTAPAGGVRRHTRSAWLAWSLLLLPVAAKAVTFVLFVVPDTTRPIALKVSDGATSGVVIMAYAPVGATILARRTANVIGWLSWAIGFALALGDFGSIEAAKRIAADPGRVELVLYQLAQVMFIVPLLGLLPLLVLVSHGPAALAPLATCGVGFCRWNRALRRVSSEQARPTWQPPACQSAWA